MYEFTATQQFFQGDSLQNYTLSAVVKVDCYSGKRHIKSPFKLFVILSKHALNRFTLTDWLLQPQSGYPSCMGSFGMCLIIK